MQGDILEFKVRSSTLSLGGTRKLNEILKKFFDTVDQYCRYEEGEDAPYWYNERATLSIFAGAIWRSGELALEEFSTTKFDENSQSEKSGRADLWFSCSNVNFICEAKQYRRHPNTKLSVIIQPAIDDVKKHEKNFPHMARLALTFWIPWIKDKNIESDFDTIRAALKIAMEEQTIDLYSLVAPQSSRNNIRESEDSSFPCVIQLGKFQFLPEDARA